MLFSVLMEAHWEGKHCTREEGLGFFLDLECEKSSPLLLKQEIQLDSFWVFSKQLRQSQSDENSNGVALYRSYFIVICEKNWLKSIHLAWKISIKNFHANLYTVCPHGMNSRIKLRNQLFPQISRNVLSKTWDKALRTQMHWFSLSLSNWLYQTPKSKLEINISYVGIIFFNLAILTLEILSQYKNLQIHTCWLFMFYNKKKLKIT